MQVSKTKQTHYNVNLCKSKIINTDTVSVKRELVLRQLIKITQAQCLYTINEAKYFVLPEKTIS